MGISLRPMTTNDIPVGMRLKEQAGWNQLPADWQRFLALEPEGCFVAQWNDLPVATTTTCIFDTVGWIAMVLVDRAFRHRGIATRLVRHALDYLKERSVATVRLDATQLGQPVYEQMGFVVQHHLVRMQGVARGKGRQADVVAVDAADLDELVALDQSATGTNRRRLIQRLADEYSDSIYLARNDGRIVGHAMLRPGANATQIGPAIAADRQTGLEVCDWAYQQCAGGSVFIDIPLQNHAAIQWAHSRGLVEQRRFARMVHGQSVKEDTSLLWASSGPEKG